MGTVGLVGSFGVVGDVGSVGVAGVVGVVGGVGMVRLSHPARIKVNAIIKTIVSVKNVFFFTEMLLIGSPRQQTSRFYFYENKTICLCLLSVMAKLIFNVLTPHIFGDYLRFCRQLRWRGYLYYSVVKKLATLHKMFAEASIN